MGNTRNTGFLQNAVKVASNGDISLMHGNTMLMQISASGAITTTGVISGSNALSASYAVNATTSSFAASATSASYALNATTSSFAASATTTISYFRAGWSNPRNNYGPSGSYNFDNVVIDWTTARFPSLA
jgi:uncharacterized iron-regulated protein